MQVGEWMSKGLLTSDAVVVAVTKHQSLTPGRSEKKGGSGGGGTEETRLVQSCGAVCIGIEYT